MSLLKSILCPNDLYYLQIIIHPLKFLDNWSSGTRTIFNTLPAPYIAPSAASPAYSPYFADTTLPVPFAIPLPAE